MKKISILVIVFILLILPFVFAEDVAIVNQNTVVWCDITNNFVFFPVDQANITIKTPEGNIFINNQNTNFIDNGIYNYNFTPNVSGNWYMYCSFYNTTSLIAQASQSVYVYDITKFEDQKMEIAIIIGLICLIFVLIFTSKDMAKKPSGEIDNFVFKILSTKNISVLIYLIASWVVFAMISFMYNIAIGQSYESIMYSIYLVSAYGIAGFNILYLSVYIIYLISKKLRDSVQR